jgi:hypothetical protein
MEHSFSWIARKHGKSDISNDDDIMLNPICQHSVEDSPISKPTQASHLPEAFHVIQAETLRHRCAATELSGLRAICLTTIVSSGENIDNTQSILNQYSINTHSSSSKQNRQIYHL